MSEFQRAGILSGFWKFSWIKWRKEQRAQPFRACTASGVVYITLPSTTLGDFAMPRIHASLLVLACAALSLTCSAEERSSAPKKTALDIAREVIAAQCELLKALDVDKMKANVTERQRERITKENLEKGKKELEAYKLEDLVESAEEGEYDGKKTIKIKMKNGRSLTTLMEIDGKWLADTIWFK
jgi:hypothetical protein